MDGTPGDRVHVYCRVRPHLDESDATRRCLTVSREHAQVVLHSASEDKVFTFDHAGDEATTQEEVFRAVGVPITEACMAGYNTTIFAYGQTGAGKTFTILGPDVAHGGGGGGGGADERAATAAAGDEISEQSGLTPRALAYIFSHIARTERTSDGAVNFLCKCSYLEIYNEQLTDLLDQHGGAAPPRLREDLRHGIHVENLETVNVSSVREAMRVLASGAAHRRVAATSMNKESSRSHAVFTLTIESQSTNARTGLVSTRSAQFNLVDLAGSERQKDTHATGQRLQEACNINKSLSALGNVIMALVTSASSGRSRHVPYRDSKLTLLLKDSLGGNARTAIIANVSPLARSFAETLSTLKFAQRAKMIRNNAVVNEESAGGVGALQAEIKRLREALTMHAASGVDLTEGAAARALSASDPCAAERAVALRDALERERAATERLRVLDGQLARMGQVVQRHCARQRSLKLLVRLREAQLHADGAHQPLSEAAERAAAAALARPPPSMHADADADADEASAALAAAEAEAEEEEGPVDAETVIARLQHAYEHHPEVVRLALEREELAMALAAACSEEGEAAVAKLRRDMGSLKAELLRQVTEAIALREQLSALQADGGGAGRAHAAPSANVSPVSGGGGGGGGDDDEGGGGGEGGGGSRRRTASPDTTALAQEEVRALRSALAASEAAARDASARHRAELAAVRSEHEGDLSAVMGAMTDLEARAAKAEGQREQERAEMSAVVDEYEALLREVAPGAAKSAEAAADAAARAAAAAAAEHELRTMRDAAAALEAETAAAHARADAAEAARAAAVEAEARACRALADASAESLTLEAALKRATTDYEREAFDKSLLADTNEELLEATEYSRQQLAEAVAARAAEGEARGRAEAAQAAAARELEAAAAEHAAQLEQLRAELDAARTEAAAARADADAARADGAAAAAESERALAEAHAAASVEAAAAAAGAAHAALGQALGAAQAERDALLETHAAALGAAEAAAAEARGAAAEADEARAADAAALAAARQELAAAAARAAAAEEAHRGVLAERDAHAASLAHAEAALAEARGAAAEAAAARAADAAALEAAQAELADAAARAAAAEEAMTTADRAHAEQLAAELGAAAEAADARAAADLADARADGERALADARAAAAARLAEAEARADDAELRAEDALAEAAAARGAAEAAEAAAEALRDELEEARGAAAALDAAAAAAAEQTARAAQLGVALEAAQAAGAEAGARCEALGEELARATARLAEAEAQLADATADAARARADAADAGSAGAADAAAVDALRAAVREAAEERRGWLAEIEGLRARAASADAAALEAGRTADAANASAQDTAARLAATAAELDKLVGHQNPRQKIQLHVKIKEENNALKAANTRLQEHARRLERVLGLQQGARAGAKAGRPQPLGGVEGADKENAGATNVGAGGGAAAPDAAAPGAEGARDALQAEEEADARAHALERRLAAAEAERAELQAALDRVLAFAQRCEPARAHADEAEEADKENGGDANAPAALSVETPADKGDAAEQVLKVLTALHAANGTLGQQLEAAEHARRMAAEHARIRHLESISMLSPTAHPRV